MISPQPSATGIALDLMYVKRAIALATGVRIALFIISYIIGRTFLGRAGSVYDIMHDTLCRWDAIHFINIAQQGYNHDYLVGNYLFFPALIAVVAYVIGDFFVSGLLVSFVASVAAGYFLQKLVSMDEVDSNAVKALWYFYLFPTAYFLAVPYSESVFICCSIASFYFARKEKWLGSGMMAMVAAATRINGVLLLPALLVEAFTPGPHMPPKKALWLMLTPLGLFANLFNSWYVLGNPFAYTDLARKYFYSHAVLPWNNIESVLMQYLVAPPSSFRTISSEYVLVACFLTVCLLLIGAGAQWLRISYQVYAWAQIALIFSNSWSISAPRYILIIFPIFIVLAKLARNDTVHNVFSVTTTLCMGGLFVLLAMGWWAF